MNSNALPFALGAILLGVVAIVFRDFALQWQPVPPGFPLRVPLAFVSGSLLIIGGIAILGRQYARQGALLLAAAYTLWLLILHGPIVASKPGDFGTWNGVAEVVFMIAGAITLYAAAAGKLSAKFAHGVCIAAGLSALAFGAAHFRYVEFVAALVPSWPWPRISRVEPTFRPSRNRVVTRSTVGKAVNSSGFLIISEVIRMRTALVIDSDKRTSSRNGGIGRIRRTMIPMTPTARPTSPRATQPRTSLPLGRLVLE